MRKEPGNDRKDDKTRKKTQLVPRCPSRKGNVLNVDRQNIRYQSLENLLWERPQTCCKTDLKIERIKYSRVACVDPTSLPANVSGKPFCVFKVKNK